MSLPAMPEALAPFKFEFVSEIPGYKKVSKRPKKKHKHYRVTVTYTDGDKFVRVYTDLGKAQKYAIRARKSPFARRVVVQEVQSADQSM
jgi:hypothetical protein